MRSYSQLTGDQLRAADFLEARGSGALWAGCGCGKTAAALTAIKRLIDGFNASRVLVVAPRLVAERVWRDEVETWEHLRGLRVSRIVGTAKQRLAAIDAEADVYAISRDNVVWLESLFIDMSARRQIKRWKWDTVVLDESQSFKSNSAKRFKSIRRLRRLFPRCWLLSGSPMPNGYQDLWTQAYLIDGGRRLGLTYTSFLEKYFKKSLNDGIPSFEIRPEAGTQIEAALADCFAIMRDMQPPVPTNFIKVSLSRAELTSYRRMARHSVLSLGGAEITAVNAGVLWGKLLQLSNGAIYDEARKWHLVHDRKIEALLELLESMPRPVLIGYHFIHDRERLLAALSKKTQGRVALLRTSQDMDDWRQGKIDIGAIHPASAGHGLNDLYTAGCQHLIWFGFTANREHYDQLNGRLIGGHRRTGKNITIHHLVAEGTLDEEARDLLGLKGAQQSDAQIRIAQKLKGELTCRSEDAQTSTSQEESKIRAASSPSDQKTPLIAI